MPFTRSADGYHLIREGGHSARRVIHVADATGFAVQQTLTEKLLAHPNITVLQDHIAIDLITGKKLGLEKDRCYGAYALDIASGEIITVAADATLIATGGAGKVYLLHHEPGYFDRRWHRHGLACRLSCGEHGVHPVSSDLSLPPASQVFSDLRGGAR